MIRRSIFDELDAALRQRHIIIITGMRRAGKTTAAKYLLSKVPAENQAYFDLERVEMREIFRQKNYAHIAEALKTEGVDLSEKTYIAIDEIQLVPEITSVIKYLYDTYTIKFIITGSSSFYLKNHFSESLAGRKRVFILSPLSFGEYLRFNGVEMPERKNPLKPVLKAAYEKFRAHYENYLEYGGFPEVALMPKPKLKAELLKDIINSYLNIDVQFLADFTKKDEIYKVIKLLAARAGGKVDFTKMSSISGIDRKKIKEYISFFEQTFLIRQLPPFVKNIDREIAVQKKLYFTDTGILNVLAKTGSGALFENAVANQLAEHGELKYYSRKTGQEIDFILDDAVAVEAKETPSIQDYQTLLSRAKAIGMKKVALVCRHWGKSDWDKFSWGGGI